MEQQVVLVTGASSGIGRETAILLAKTGHVVYGAARRLEKLQELSKYGVIPLVLDVTKEYSCQNALQQILNQQGTLDILINNAGITRDGLLMRMKEADWDAVLETNLKGVYNCSKAVMRTMMKQKSGRIVNMASVVGEMGNAGQANYAAAKAGVIGFTKSLAKEVASRGITVNAVAPGFIATDMTSVLTDEQKAEMARTIPLGRAGQPQDVANAVLFLVSEEAAYITGQVLNVDGGMVM
jgi:3-oxoacyl-[acyl-carrier protein] reductase